MTSDTNSSLAIDVQSLGKLRLEAKQNTHKALQETARQFEALFLNMLIKSMREAAPNDETYSGQDAQIYNSMLDQQLSQNIAKRGIGLADYLLRQMKPAAQLSAPGPAGPIFSASLPHETSMSQKFQTQMSTHAQEAAKITGVPATFILGQAALESGWGRRQIVNADGSPSHNLFGIKATSSWNGRVAEITTTEYVNGVSKKVIQKFRSYNNYADSFRDYAVLLRDSRRYEQVIANGQTLTGFAEGMQKAGYATDPHYAEKLSRIIKQVHTS